MKNKLLQHSFNQKGVIIFTKEDSIKIIPYFQESPIGTICRTLKVLGEGWRCTFIYATSSLIELNNLKFTEYNMNFIRTGFQGVSSDGFNIFMDKSIYC